MTLAGLEVEKVEYWHPGGDVSGVGHLPSRGRPITWWVRSTIVVGHILK
jgi:hypothetical protein